MDVFVTCSYHIEKTAASVNVLRGSANLNHLIFQLFFIILNMKLYVCRNLCENFRQIGHKIKQL